MNTFLKVNPARVPVLALAAVVLAGCGSATSTAASTPISTTTSPTSHPTPAAIHGCKAGSVRLSTAPAGAGMGHEYLNVVATNTGAVPCTLRGAPGVRHVTTGNHDVGIAAQADSSHPVGTVILQPGEQAAAVLDESSPYNYPPGDCELAVVLGLRVVLPGDNKAVVVPEASNTCANTKITSFFVQPFTKDFHTVGMP